MNIHLMMEGKFADKFVEFISEFYPEQSNYTYIYRNKINGDISCNTNADCAGYVSNLFDEVDLSLVGSDDKLFIHGFYLPHFVKYGLFAASKLNKNQIVLIIYGADLYNNRYLLQDDWFHPGVWLQEIWKRRLVKKAGVFMTFAAPDYDLIKEWYGADGKQFDILYPSNADYEQLSRIRKISDSVDTHRRILLGNSATVTNRHEEALRWLSKYKDEDIEIICPLSYGDLAYGKQIAEMGHAIFGDKFIPITDYMDISAYTDLLNSVDIAVYNNNRQQATGNIEILGYLGKKIYVRSDIATWGHYVVRDGCRFFDTMKIPELDYSDFCKLGREDIDYNEQYFLNIWDNNYLKKLWDEVMQYGN